MKSEVAFDLEKAAWPALLVDANGVVLLANAAAKNIFGAALNAAPAPLASLWSSENSGTAVDFLALWRESQPMVTVLKFRVASGQAVSFPTAICQAGEPEKKQIALQLLSGVSALSAESPAEPDTALKQKLDCMLQLAQTVSLDFNNALTGVLAHTSLLLGKAEAGHPWRLSLVEIEKSAARAAEIATELAQFSRQEKETRRSPAGNLNAVVTRCVDFFRKASGGRFTWNLMLERYLFEARFDEAKVQQAVQKILENAIDAFGPGGSGSITVQTRNVELTQPTQDRNVRLAAGAYVCVEISDSGAGIDPEIMTRIFEPFFTTKGPPHRGLGLALVYGLITNYGGGVAISSQPGKGTSARIYLPSETSRVQQPAASGEALLGSGTILVVDDESLMLTMAETILSDFGYKVLTANGGLAALNLLSREDVKVDLIITDLVMPGMGGRELMDRVRRLGLKVPILCTSGYVLAEDKRAAAGYLRKPFTSTELLQKVKSVMSLEDGS
jgi:two-component system, cell cycle sensor histidine kinase and response regulator CckA